RCTSPTAPRPPRHCPPRPPVDPPPLPDALPTSGQLTRGRGQVERRQEADRQRRQPEQDEAQRLGDDIPERSLRGDDGRGDARTFARQSTRLSYSDGRSTDAVLGLKQHTPASSSG